MPKRRILLATVLIIAVFFVTITVNAVSSIDSSETTPSPRKVQFTLVIKDEDVLNQNNFDNFKAYITQNPQNPLKHEPRIEQLSYYTDYTGNTFFIGVADAANIVTPFEEGVKPTLMENGEQELTQMLNEVLKPLHSDSGTPL